jgi:hypothetical protein
MAKAARAIDYLDSKHIVSWNKEWFPWNNAPWTDYGKFLYGAVRCASAGLTDPQRLQRWEQLQTTMTDPNLNWFQRRWRVEEHMSDWGWNYFWTGGQMATETPEEHRIRFVRRALKIRAGNCHEKSCIVATWLLENRPANETVRLCACNVYDHVFVVYGHPGAWDGVLGNLHDDAVIVDGWQMDWYQAKHPFHFHKGNIITPITSPVRTHVRRMINNEPKITILEECHSHWPPVYSPNFRLNVAERPISDYEHPITQRRKSMHALTAVDRQFAQDLANNVPGHAAQVLSEWFGVSEAQVKAEFQLP